MAGPRKALHRVFDGSHDAAIPFADLRVLLLWLGFVESIRGSHHLFRHGEGLARINLQRDGRHAKLYQVRQVRAVLASRRRPPEDPGVTTERK